MKKIIIYLLLLAIVYSGFKEARSTWEDNKEDIGSTVSNVSESASGWFDSFTSKSGELKDVLNEKLKEANDKYEEIKNEINDTADMVTEKKEQLDRALKEMEEAKKALDELLEKEKELEDAEDTEDSEGVEETPVEEEA
ncbi:MAG: hypothetical protein P1V18_02235 [Candidatus Gracilibacteria bacterium]|nr:hypothetical protein [Candidatus Gracilibacteria bacterium]